MEARLVVWTDGERWYRIPEDGDLPSGEAILTNFEEREWHVDPTALATYEIGEEEAGEIVAAQFAMNLGAAVGATVAGFATLFRAAARDASSPGQDVEPSIEADPTADVDQPDLILARLSEVLEGMMQTFADVAGGNPERGEAVDQLARQIAERMRDEGQPLGAQAIEEFPARLRTKIAEERPAVDVDGHDEE